MLFVFSRQTPFNVHIHDSERAVIAHACHGHTLLLSAGLSVLDRMLVVTLSEVCVWEREKSV